MATALTLQPELPTAATLYHPGRLEAALVSIERALALDPDLEVALVGLEHVRKALN